jgi:hypothetical protein
MSQKHLNIGAIANDHTGTNKRVAWGYVEDNFSDLYSIQSRTVNAGDVRFQGGATNEARIALADAQAVAEQASILYIPAFMLPYDITLCPATDGVRRVREGGNSSVYDLRAYGAAPDLSAFCDAAWSAMVDGAITTADPLVNIRLPRGAIHIPAGYYKFANEALVQGVQGLQLAGDGSNTSVLVFTGTLTNGLNLDGVAHSHISDVSVATSGVVTNLIKCDWGQGIRRSPTGNVFSNIGIGVGNPLGSGTFVNGFAVGTDVTTNLPANAIDGMTFSRVVVNGNWTLGNTTTYQAGITLGDGASGNCLDHCFYNCEMIRCRDGYKFSNASGFFFGGQNEICETDFMVSQPIGPMKVSGFRSEQAYALFKLAGGSGSAVPIELDNILWYGDKLTGAQNYTVIQYDWSGSFFLRNVTIRGMGNVAAIAQVVCAPNTHLTVIAEGFTAPNAQTIAQTFPNAGGFKVLYLITAYSARNTAETALVNQIPFQVYTTNVSPNLPPAFGFLALATGLIAPTEAVLVSGVDVRAGNMIKVTLTAARVVGAPLNPTAGQRLTYTLIQDGTGGWGVTWNAVFKQAWVDTGNTLNKRSSISFNYDGTNWNQDGAQAPYV